MVAGNDEQLDVRIKHLIEEGLRKLGLSRPDEARRLWEQVLELNPDNTRAKEYIQYLDKEGIFSDDWVPSHEPDEVEENARDTAPPGDTEQGSGASTKSLTEPASGHVEETSRKSGAEAGLEQVGHIDDTRMDIPSETAPFFIPVDANGLVEEEISGEREMNSEVFSESVDIQSDDAKEASPQALDKEISGVDSGQGTVAEPEERTSIDSGKEEAEDLQDGINPLLKGAQDLFNAGDYSEAYELVKKVLDSEPENKEASTLEKRLKETLIELYKGELGSMKAVPRVEVNDRDMVWSNLTPEEAYLLSRIDGILTFQEVVDLSFMDEFEVLRMLASFLKNKLISK